MSEVDKDFLRSAKRSVVSLFSTKVLIQIVRWVITFFVIRLLHPEDYGLNAIAAVVVELGAIFAGEGMSASLIRKKVVTDDDINKIRTLIYCVGLTIFLFIYLMSGTVADIYNDSRLEGLIKLASFGILFSALSSVPLSILNKKMDFSKISIILFVSTIAGAVLTLILAFLDFKVYSLVFGALLTNILNTILSIYYARIDSFKFNFKFSSINKDLNYNFILLVSALIWLLYSQIDIIIVGKVIPAEILGIYVVAIQLAVMPINKIIPAFKQVGFPVFVKLHANNEDCETYFFKYIRMVMNVFLPITIILCFTSNHWIPIVLGNKWSDVSLLLMILTISLPFRVLIELYTPLLKALDNARELFILLASVVIFLAPIFYFVSDYGITAVAVVWVTVFPVVVMMMVFLINNKIGINNYKLSKTLIAVISPNLLVVLVLVSSSEFEIYSGIKGLLFESILAFLIYSFYFIKVEKTFLRSVKSMFNK